MNERIFPREKAIKYGISTLENEELLALIIKSAYKNKNVYELAEEVIELANGFHNLLSLTFEELISIKGIKQAKALEILAILEISKRLSKIEKINQIELTNPKKVVEWLRFNISFSSEEEFFVVYMNSKGTVLKAKTMFKGSKNSTSIGIDRILRTAILIKASSILVAHNHPSDNLRPSKEDINLTNNLKNACAMLSIPLIDHIIVGKTGYFSFNEHNMLK